MGNRIVELEFRSRPSAELEALLDQVVDFAEFHGIGAISTPPEAYPGMSKWDWDDTKPVP